MSEFSHVVRCVSCVCVYAKFNNGLYITDVGFEPVRMRRRRLALQSTAPLPTALPKFPQKGSSNSTDKDYGLYRTLRITGALMNISLWFSMNYVFSHSNGSEACLYNHTRDIK